MSDKSSNNYINEIRRILPYQMDFYLSEFKNTCSLNPITAFSVENLSTEFWFNIFKKEVLESINKKKFLPVCRFCDGEFIFMNKGLDLIDHRIKLIDKIKIIVKNILTRLNLIQFSAFTSNKYTSGQYSYKEIVSLNSPNSLTSGPINPPCTTIATIPTTISGPSESFIDQRREFCKKNTRIVVNPVKAIK